MRTLFRVLLTAPVVARHVVEGPIGEIVEATDALAQLDHELESPQTAPSNPDAHLIRGRARMEQGRYEDAVKDFQETLRLRPDDKAALASLKLSEGRARHPGGGARPDPSSGGPSAPAAASPAPFAAVAVSLSDFDRRVEEKNRINQRTMEHYNAALAAQAANGWDKALSEIDKALTLQPDAVFLREQRASLLAARDAAAHAKESKLHFHAAGDEPEQLGASSFIKAFFHYMGQSGKPCRIDFKDLDTSDIRITDFPQVAAILRKPARDVSVGIDSTMFWTSKGVQWLLLGDISLRLRGTLAIRDDCSWQFEGSLRSWDDKYDFNASRRGRVGEALTAIGRHTAGKVYTVEIRGVKSMRDAGKAENCR